MPQCVCIHHLCLRTCSLQDGWSALCLLLTEGLSVPALAEIGRKLIAQGTALCWSD